MARWGWRYSSKAFTWVKLRRSIDPDQFHLLTESDFQVGLGLTNPWNFPAKDRSGKLEQLEESHLGRLIAKLIPGLDSPAKAIPQT
jgi:hypothetical protein